MGGFSLSQRKSIVRPSLKRDILPALHGHDPQAEGHMAIHIGRRDFITLLGGAAAAWPLAARAQQSAKVYRIGFLSAGAQVRSQLWPIFVNGLREFGWIEGRNIVFDRRYADNSLDRLSELATELVRLDVDVIVAVGTLAPLAAKRATASIPIVMMNAGDPVGSGLVASLARPGGNVTGMSLMAPDLGGKRLELLKEVVPHLSRVAIIWNAVNPYSALVFGETQSAAKKLTIELQSLEVRAPGDFDGALATTMQKRVDALVIVEDPLTFNHLEKVAEFCADNRLAAIYGLREFADAGGLMTYGASQADLFRRSVVLVDKILRGVKPSDLPVQQPTKFELVINLKTAKALGLTVPETLLARADEVIE
jgi:putative ABC transport system substrate-binding protein